MIHGDLNNPSRQTLVDDSQFTASATKPSKSPTAPRWAAWFVMGVLAAAPALAVESNWYTVDGGGAMASAGGPFEVSGTIAQSDASAVMTGGDFELSGGFWAGVVAAMPGDCEWDGDLDLSDFACFVACMTGPGGTALACEPVDFNLDGDVDLEDYQAFEKLF